nr:ACP S-malonyltransferase [Blastocatellia bacterium]
ATQGEVCSPANINSPSQIVIAGDSAAIDRACDILKIKGAKRAIRLNVSAPFHCALMMPAQEKLADDLHGVNYAAFEFPIFHNVDAGENIDPTVVAGKLTSQVSSSVRWLASVQNMIREGVDRFIEIGPGKVLTGLVRQISRDVPYANIENSESLKEVLQ